MSHKDPLILLLQQLKSQQLKPEDQNVAYDTLWQILSNAGQHIARLYETELPEDSALLALTAIGRAQQYEQEASQWLGIHDPNRTTDPDVSEAELSTELDFSYAADLQTTAALCGILYSSLLTPTETSYHAARAAQLIDELEQLDPAAADWHQQQQTLLLRGAQLIPIPAKHAL